MWRRCLVAVFSLVCIALLASCGDIGRYNATNISGSKLGLGWQLPDHHGQLRQLADFKGQVVLVSFGFTQCPDVCPTTLVSLADTLRLLGDDANKVQVLFVTIDPERDTAEILKDYVTQFNPSFLGLSGRLDATAQMAKSFNVHYAKVHSKAEGSYTMEHSTGTYVFDTQGDIRLFAPMSIAPQALADDIKQLLSEHP